MSRREQRLVGTAAFVSAVLVVAVVISLLTAGHSSSRGCIDFGFPYSTGGQEV